MAQISNEELYREVYPIYAASVMVDAFQYLLEEYKIASPIRRASLLDAMSIINFAEQSIDFTAKLDN